MPASAPEEYRTRLASRRATCDAFDALDARFSYARLATFVAGIALVLLAWNEVVSFWLLLLPLLIFAWLVRFILF